MKIVDGVQCPRPTLRSNTRDCLRIKNLRCGDIFAYKEVEEFVNQMFMVTNKNVPQAPMWRYCVKLETGELIRFFEEKLVFKRDNAILTLF